MNSVLTYTEEDNVSAIRTEVYTKGQELGDREIEFELMLS